MTDRETLVELAASGMTLRAIASRVGRNAETVRCHIENYAHSRRYGVRGVRRIAEHYLLIRACQLADHRFRRAHPVINEIVGARWHE